MKKRVSILWGRWALVVGLAGVAVLLFSLLPAMAEPNTYHVGWQAVVSEEFDTFPGPGWHVYDESSTDGGEYLWGTTSYTFTSASASVWAVGGGAQGSLLDPITDTYPSNVDSLLVYGPLDLAEGFDARLEFEWFLDTGPGDWFSGCVVADVNSLSDGCQGTAVSGRIGTWVEGMLSLKPYMHDEVWIVFQFTSNDDGVSGRGAFVDDVVVYVDYGYLTYLPLARRDPTPTPTPILSYFDDFSNPASGWPQVQTLIPGTSSYYRMRYDSGTYRIMLDQGGPLVWFYQPDVFAPYIPPSDKYCIQVDVLIQRGQDPYQEYNYYSYWANGGLIFGANEANTNLYALCLTVGAETPSGADLGWFVVHNPEYVYPRKGCSYINETDPNSGVIYGEATGLNINKWQHIAVGVDGNSVTVFINGIYRGQWSIAGLDGMTRVGLIAGDYEVTPVDFRFDNFRVDPNVNCTP